MESLRTADMSERDRRWWTEGRILREGPDGLLVMDGCPNCGGRDVATFGAGFCDEDSQSDFNRTDANISELAECEDCGWASARDPWEAEEERILEARAAGDSWYEQHVTLFRRIREAATA